MSRVDTAILQYNVLCNRHFARPVRRRRTCAEFFARGPRRGGRSARSPRERFALDRLVTARRRETTVFLRVSTFQSIKRPRAKLRGAYAFTRVPARKAIFFFVCSRNEAKTSRNFQKIPREIPRVRSGDGGGFGLNIQNFKTKRAGEQNNRLKTLT